MLTDPSIFTGLAISLIFAVYATRYYFHTFIASRKNLARAFSQMKHTVRLKITKSLKLLENLARTRSDYLVYLSIIVYTVIFSYYTILRHYGFKTSAWDLGIYDQALWSTLKYGKLFYYTPELLANPSGSLFGVHFTPILFMVLPIYAIYPSPETLLVLQSFMLALGALPLYWLAKDEFRSNLVGLAFALVYLLYPPIHSVNWYDFHPQAFLPTFLLFAFFYFKRHKWLKSFVFTILALMCIEIVPLITFFFGLYGVATSIVINVKLRRLKALMKERAFLYSLTVIVLSVVWFVVAMKVIDMFNPERYEWAILPPWGHLGSNLMEIIINVVTHPFYTIAFMLSSLERVNNILYLFSPVAFLPLLAPLELLLTISWLVPALLAEKTYPVIGYQYAAFLTAQIFIGLVYGVKNLSLYGVKNFPEMNRVSSIKLKISERAVTLVLLCTLISFAALSPLTLGISYMPGGRPQIGPHEKLLMNILELVPSNASILTQDDIFPHVCHRLNAYVVYVPPDVEVEYVLIDLNSPFSSGFLPPPFDNISRSDAFLKVLEKNEYGLFASADGILLFKRGYSGWRARLPDIEFRGINVSNATDVYLYYIEEVKVGEI